MNFYENSTYRQFPDTRFQFMNDKRSAAFDPRISEAANRRLLETPLETEEKIHLRDTLLKLSPLRLTMSDVEAFSNLAHNKVFRAKDTKYAAGSRHNLDHAAVEAKLKDDAEKWKASNFCASSITIGSWKEVARREGALVAKCYYAKKKLVWEIMKKSLKSKIEVQWSDILAIRASTMANRHGILEVELNIPPTFYQETDPLPRKHTLWKVSSDFTDGQALIYRRHYLEFAPGVLDKHYEKLLQCDSRLLMLSQRPYPSLCSPYFHSDFYDGNREISLSMNGHGENDTSCSQLLFPSFPTPFDAEQQVQANEQINQRSFSSLSPQSFHMVADNGSTEISSDLNEHGANYTSSLQPPFPSFTTPFVSMQQVRENGQINQSSSYFNTASCNGGRESSLEPRGYGENNTSCSHLSFPSLSMPFVSMQQVQTYDQISQSYISNNNSPGMEFYGGLHGMVGNQGCVYGYSS